jgi:SCY1-like protein 2
LVDAALGTLPVILSILDYSTIKNEVFPVIASVFSKTSSMGIKIRGLEALKTLCGGSATPENDDGFGNFEQTASKPKNNSVILDKYTIQEKVVPLLKAIKTKEPAVMTAALDVFQEIGKIADSDFLATDVLPVLWSFSLGPLLNLQQFQAYMTLIKGLSTRVEQEHTRKLQEMSTSNPTVASRNDFMSFGGLTDRNGLDDANGTTNDFEALVLGKKGLSSPAADSFDVWNNPEQIPSNQLPVQVSGQASPTPPAFSWSTPSASSTAQNNSFAKPANTSNPPLNAFSVLQPQSTSTTSFSSSQSIQPTNWSAPQTNAWSSQTDTTTPSLSFSNTWSSANAPLAPSNPWSSASQSHLQPSAFSQPLRPNTSTQSSFSIPPPPTSPYSTFGIAPPPTTIMSPMTGALNTLASSQKYPQPQQQRQQQQQQSGRKQGLDKYESLI